MFIDAEEPSSLKEGTASFPTWLRRFPFFVVVLVPPKPGGISDRGAGEVRVVSTLPTMDFSVERTKIGQSRLSVGENLAGPRGGEIDCLITQIYSSTFLKKIFWLHRSCHALGNSNDMYKQVGLTNRKAHTTGLNILSVQTLNAAAKAREIFVPRRRHFWLLLLLPSSSCCGCSCYIASRESWVVLLLSKA